MRNALKTPTKGPVLVTGANGQLGSELVRLMQIGKFKQSFLAACRNSLDITDALAVQDYCQANQPRAILNCAAYTNVDMAESEQEKAFAVNEKGPANLAASAATLDIPLIHISTDYVFDGNRPGMYHEDDPANPLGVYGLSKIAGEKILLASHAKAVIIRTGWLYSHNGKNFLRNILTAAHEKNHLHVVADQTGTPTYAKDLAEAILQILPRACQGFGQIFHYANEGVASWYDFAWVIVRNTGIACTVMPISSSEYPTPARRPMCSVLNKIKIKQTFNLSIPHWMESLEKCMKGPSRG